MKKVIIGLFLTLGICSAANAEKFCGFAPPVTSKGFCYAFKDVATCNCKKSLPSFLCRSMSGIYHKMKLRYGSLENACRHQDQVAPQLCIDDWNCYLKGGVDSNNLPCNSTRLPCE